MSYYFLDEFAQDPKFGLREDYLRRLMTYEARALRIESVRKRLNGCCRGLLKTRRDIHEYTSEIIIITITHRSVHEFLSNRTQRNRMDRYLDGFNTVDAISRLAIAKSWARKSRKYHLRRPFDNLALTLVSLRSKAKPETPPYDFLASLALAWQRHQQQSNYDFVGDHLQLLCFKSGRSTRYFTDVLSGPSATWRNAMQALQHPIYSAAALDNYDYVLRELGRSPEGIHRFTPLRLLYCILSNLDCGVERGLCGVMDYIHTHHGIHPGTSANLFYTWLYPAALVSQRRYHPLPYGDENTEISLWHHILLRCYRADWVTFICPLSSRRSREALRYLGYVLENSSSTGQIRTSTNSPNLRIRLVVRVRGELQEQWLVLDPRDQDPKQATYEYENMSLAELVERWGFKNKARILELIQKNTLVLEASNEEK